MKTKSYKLNREEEKSYFKS